MVAVGYADGMVLLVRVDDGAEVLGKKPGAGAVSALGWDAGGTLLAFGTEAGEAGIIWTLASAPINENARPAAACLDVHRTSTFLNCHGSRLSMSSGNRPGRPSSGVQSV